MRRDSDLQPTLVREHVLHLVGRVTEEVFSFLGPATHALMQEGLAQTVVMVDDARHRYLVAYFDPDVQIILVGAEGSWLRRWHAMLAQSREVIREGGCQGIHVHGLWPCLVGIALARLARVRPPMHYSPHGSRSLVSFRWLAALLLKLAAPNPNREAGSTIASLPAEARTLGSIARQPVEVVEPALAAPFFEVERHETRYPLIVTGGSSQAPLAARYFEQIAVLLGGTEMRIAFNWIGTTDAASKQRLNAANVSVTEQPGAEHRASRLAASWLYVAPTGARGFPLYLAEAMCVGLPCVAVDTPSHRDVLDDGVHGFLCRDQAQMLSRIGELIDDAELRRRMGEAARATAHERFGEERFRNSLLLAYRYRA